MIKNYTTRQLIELAVTDLVNDCLDFTQADVTQKVTELLNNRNIYVTDLKAESLEKTLDNYMSGEFASEAPRYGFITGPAPDGKTMAIVADENAEENPFAEALAEEDDGGGDYVPFRTLADRVSDSLVDRMETK